MMKSVVLLSTRLHHIGMETKFGLLRRVVQFSQLGQWDMQQLSRVSTGRGYSYYLLYSLDLLVLTIALSSNILNGVMLGIGAYVLAAQYQHSFLVLHLAICSLASPLHLMKLFVQLTQEASLHF